VDKKASLFKKIVLSRNEADKQTGIRSIKCNKFVMKYVCSIPPWKYSYQCVKFAHSLSLTVFRSRIIEIRFYEKNMYNFVGYECFRCGKNKHESQRSVLFLKNNKSVSEKHEGDLTRKLHTNQPCYTFA
jgi:hypothetical protein